MNIKVLSPSLPHRSRDNAPELIVLHATAGATARSSIEHLRGVGLSYHYIIARDGKDTAKSENADGSEPIVFHCVPDAGHAFHTGSTIPTPSGLGINKASIGINLANIQRQAKPEAYPDRQIDAMKSVIAKLLADFPSIRLLTTHAVVQPWNRADPRGIDGPSMAAAFGLTFWQPSAALILQHTPKKPG